MSQKPSLSPHQTITPALRRFLLWTAAITGGAVLVIEILGAKILAPHFGTSHFVWTAQISVTLVALAAGYRAGGWLVDQSMRLGQLYAAILGAAAWVAGSILVAKPVARGCLSLNLELGSLAASGFLFFVPLFLLAMVCPFLVRVLTSTLSSVGGSVGRMSALSTVGSLAGAVLSGYLFIPLLPNSVTFAVTAAVLAAIAGIYFGVWGREGRGKANAALVVVGLLAGGGVAFDARSPYKNTTEIYRANSNFGTLQVLSTPDGQLYYLNDYLNQNTYDPKEKQSISLFTHMLHGLGRGYVAAPKRALCIGLGVGIVPMQLARGGLDVEVVEINPRVVPMAQKYFDLEPEKLKLHFEDGRSFLNRAEGPYDVIVLDAFLGDSSPSHLLSQEAFLEMRRVLAPEGAVVMNIFAKFEPGRDFLAASLEKTLRAVFQSVKIHASSRGNVFFAASPRAVLEILNPLDFEAMPFSIREHARDSVTNLRSTDPRHGIVLTDDYNPLEARDAANREEMRRSLALSVDGL